MEIKLENLNWYMYEKIQHLIDEKLLDKKLIVLFGLNSSSFCAEKYLIRQGYNVSAYVDNDEKKRRNNKLTNIQAYAPGELLQNYDDNKVILIASKYFRQMSEQVAKMGYKVGKQVFQIADFYNLETLLETKGKPQLEEMNSLQVRQSQMKLLRYVKKICEEYKLRYYICGGTLLGAVRHKGYIPWDDDIDLVMPMPDYKKFLEIAEKENVYECESVYNHPKDFYNFFAKLIDRETLMLNWEFPFLTTSGVNIDIIPLFGIPNTDDNGRKMFYNKIRNLNTQYIETFLDEVVEDKEIEQKRMELQKQIIDMMEAYEYDECEYIGYLLSKYKEKEIMPRMLYQNSKQVLFEGEYFKAAGEYQKYLQIIFGDYMQLPPESERVAIHNYKAYKR